MATANGRIEFEKILKIGGQDALTIFKQKYCGTDVQGMTMEGSRAPFKDEDQMYASQFLHVRSNCIMS